MMFVNRRRQSAACPEHRLGAETPTAREREREREDVPHDV